MRIGLDVSGGDFAPKATLHGALMALKELPSTDQIVLIGDKDVILTFLKEEKVDPGRFSIVDAPDVIGMDEQPTKALINKSESSIAVGFRMLKHKEIHAFCSAGSSGAMMVVQSTVSIQSRGSFVPALPHTYQKKTEVIAS